MKYVPYTLRRASASASTATIIVMLLAPPCGAASGAGWDVVVYFSTGGVYGFGFPREKLDGRLDGMSITVRIYTVPIFITFGLGFPSSEC